jgi:hypothetical protein
MRPDHLSNTSSEQLEGEITSYELLDLQLTDDEIARIVGNRVEQAEAFWNGELNLKNLRDTNENYWLNNSIDDSEFYDFQVPYKDPKIFVAVESLIPMALSRPPQPIVTEASDTDASRDLAKDIADVLLTKYEDLYLKAKLSLIARHLLVGYRIGVMKYGWDDTLGPTDAEGKTVGDITVETLRPHSVVIAEGVRNHDKIPLIGEYKRASIEELCYKFPDKKDDIYKEQGLSAGTMPKMSKEVGYLEVHFTYYDKSHKASEGVIWKLNTVVMGGTKTPLWNYADNSYDEEGKLIHNNFFHKPQKPYVFFNFLNLGKYIYDDTSLTEQAANQQDIVNKRGRQIVENADSANGGLVFNSDMINQESVAKLIGDPREKVMVKGDVRMAVTRVPNTQLEEYVLADKQDARSVIDNVFSTHGAIRGEVTKSKTLGQDVLSQRGDIARITTLSTALEDGMDRGYKWIVQLMKVFYTDPAKITFTNPEGATRFIGFHAGSIEDGIKIKVKSGSALPDDPMAKKDETIQAIAILDPLSIAEGLNKEKPKEFAKRIMLYRMAPDRYYEEILGETVEQGAVDPSAKQEIDVMNSGKPAPPQSSPTKEHLATHDAFLNSPEFKQLPPEIQTLHVEHVQAEVQNSKVALKQEPATAAPEQGAAAPVSGAVPPQPPQVAPPEASPKPGIMQNIRSAIGI